MGSNESADDGRDNGFHGARVARALILKNFHLRFPSEYESTVTDPVKEFFIYRYQYDPADPALLAGK